MRPIGLKSDNQRLLFLRDSIPCFGHDKTSRCRCSLIIIRRFDGVQIHLSSLESGAFLDAKASRSGWNCHDRRPRTTILSLSSWSSPRIRPFISIRLPESITEETSLGSFETGIERRIIAIGDDLVGDPRWHLFRVLTRICV